MPKKRVSVTKESSTGRNQKFHDNKTENNMTRTQLVKKIETGEYENYHVRKDKHVVPSQKGGWSVRTTGASKAARNFDTKDKAVDYARNSAKREGSELYIHKKDGTISERRSYGKDPHPPKDKR